MTAPCAIVWLDHDLRLSDNPALAKACASGMTVLPVHVRDDKAEGEWTPSAATRWWLRHSLANLAADLRERGGTLTLRRGDGPHILLELVKETNAALVCWNGPCEPAAREKRDAFRAQLERLSVTVQVDQGRSLPDTANLRTVSGGPYQVFTPFWNALRERVDIAAQWSCPDRLMSPKKCPPSQTLDALYPEEESDFSEWWEPGEAGGQKALHCFLQHALEDYETGRDIPGVEGVSRLSPWLHHGELSVGQVWREVEKRVANSSAQMRRSAEDFLRQLAWREFATHLLIHFPHTPLHPLREKYASFPWKNNHAALERWKEGATGFPMVDAGMRQLRRTGWMHNRVRMLVASFLAKDLLIPWQEGARWFWETLVDADLANNTLGWQWVAGCGADASPFFRIFNPITQGEKFDPEGRYVRQWLPELAAAPTPWIHRPWDAPSPDAPRYPSPMLDHAIARQRALAAYKNLAKNTPKET